MALIESIGNAELRRQLTASYFSRTFVVLLCYIDGEQYTADNPVSDWEGIEISVEGYSRQAVEAVQDKDSSTSALVDVTFSASESPIVYNSAICFEENSDYPSSILVLDDQREIPPGASEAINFLINFSAPLDTVVADSVDPYYDNVVLLMHFDGEEGSNAFEDSSKNGFNGSRIYPFRDVRLNSAKSKFGTTSAYFPQNTGSSIDISIAEYLDFGEENFTIEFWAFPLAGSVNCDIFSIYNSDAGNYRSLRIGIQTDSATVTLGARQRFFAAISGDATAVTEVSSFTSRVSFDYYLPAEWHHVAFTRSSNNIFLFVNGIYNSNIFEGPVYYSSGFLPCIGDTMSLVEGGQYHGFLSDLRITKGIARYTPGNYRMPAAPFPDQ